jgi:hypothetical protein
MLLPGWSITAPVGSLFWAKRTESLPKVARSA